MPIKHRAFIFIFFLIVGFLFFNPFDPYSDLGGPTVGIVIISLGALTLSLIVSSSISQTKEEIRKGTFAVSWLIGINLLLSAILFGFIVGFSLLLTLFYVLTGQGGDMAGILPLFVAMYASGIAPILVFIFSFLPSLLMYVIARKKI